MSVNIYYASNDSLQVVAGAADIMATPAYTTMPVITSAMLGKVVQYVGASDSNYKQGWNYVAVSDGAAEPTYSWRALMDSVPTSGSSNPVTSDGIYKRTPFARGGGSGSAIGGANTTAQGNNSFAFGQNCVARGTASVALGHNILAQSSYGTNVGAYNVGSNSTLFEIGNGTGAARSNIVEVNSTSMNVNGDIKCHNLVVPVGGYEETVLYEMTDYTIPQQTSVTLSDDATNYDSIVVFGIFKSNSSSTNFWRTRARTDIMVSQYDFTKELPDTFLLHNSNESASSAGNYCFSDTSTITKTSGDLTWIEKVIGIKYPKLYVPPVSLNQAPATLLTNQTEEPTDEMR